MDTVIEWRPIPGWPGYKASSNGQIASYRRKLPRVMRQVSQRGYPVVMLCADGRRLGRQVGIWVLEAFVGPCPDGLECSHRDGNPWNNAVENLVWETHAKNMARRLGHGTAPRGSANANAKLTGRDVALIRRMRELEIPPFLIATVFEVDPSTISDIDRGKTWKP